MVTKSVTTIVRPFDGSLRDAEGLLAVERATFDECPYTPEQLRGMLVGGQAAGQRAWLALAGDEVVGFAVAFATFGLRGPVWEIDLLAVHPGWTGRGLATRLVRATAGHGATLAARARAAVATDNEGSARAFRRAGFAVHAPANHLLIDRPDGTRPAAPSIPGVEVRPARGPAEVGQWLPNLPRSVVPAPPGGPGVSLLVAEDHGAPAGCAELIEVQTVLYRGLWIESLVASSELARLALVRAAVRQAVAAGLDEVGAMVPGGDTDWQESLLGAGFQSLGHFYWLVARLPLPGLAAAESLA